MITTRTSKGSALTYAELDGNFTDLDARTTTAWAMQGVQPDVLAGDPDGPGLILFSGGIYAYSYPNSQVTQSYANFDVPLQWASGTDLYAGIHWSPGAATLTGTVRFGLEFVGAPLGGVFNSPSTMYFESAADGTAYKHYRGLSAPVSGAAVSANQRFLIRIFRDGAHVNDTFNGDIFIIGIDFYYQVNKFGLQSI